MKKRFLSLFILLSAAFGTLIAPVSLAADDVCFLATNDTLHEVSLRPISNGGGNCMPASVLTNFGIYCYADGTLAIAYTADKQLIFDLETGLTYDGASDNTYWGSATTKNGVLYVPVDAVCLHFGLSSSYIEGTGTGDILRIKDSGAVLSDSQFVAAASTLMQSRYNEYKASIATPAPSAWIPPPVPEEPEPTQSPSPSPATARRDTKVYIYFLEMPSRELLDMLDGSNIHALFFLTGQDILSDPSTVRRIVGSGHEIGILSGTDHKEEWFTANSLVFNTAWIYTIYITSLEDASGCLEFAEENSLFYVDIGKPAYGLDDPSLPDITGFLDSSSVSADIWLKCGENTQSILPSLIDYLVTQKFNLQIVRESNYGDR